REVDELLTRARLDVVGKDLHRHAALLDGVLDGHIYRRQLSRGSWWVSLRSPPDRSAPYELRASVDEASAASQRKGGNGGKPLAFLCSFTGRGGCQMAAARCRGRP